MTPTSAPSTPTSTATFDNNLARLRLTEPALAERLAQADSADLLWTDSRAGRLTASIDNGGRPLQLASKYDPVAEADKLTNHVDHAKHAGVVVLGFGLGYHVAKIARDMGDSGVLIVFDPDVSVLRASLEKIDHTGWLGRSNIIIADDVVDRAELLSRVDRLGGVLTQGTVIVTHPPTRQLHADALASFSDMFTEALKYCRTNVATALVNAARTARNLCSNLSWYSAGETTNELHNIANGFPAVCVGAGPSLAKNIRLLSNPDVRRNVVIISAQTTLKVLLQHGIKPDFVTALDYAEISKRFYEGLPDLPDVTLVAEPKAHPSILESFPGPVRVTNEDFLDRLLGDLARPIVPIQHGATVAHLSFYLAQHLGCDPIILIGQDLGFSDGLYYCPGTAIHEVWAPELNAFNTLEMMEWQRIVRHRGHLSRQDDVNGRPIFSDEQMLTYLKQFERDFASAPQTIIDATEGGVPKAHTTKVALSQALSDHATKPVPAFPVCNQRTDGDRLQRLIRLLEKRLAETKEIRQLAVRSMPILARMIEHRRDRGRMDDLFRKLQRLQHRITELNDMFELINQLNTIGTFKRARNDRAIRHENITDVHDKQVRQLERDVENIEWLIQASDETLAILGDSLSRVKERR